MQVRIRSVTGQTIEVEVQEDAKVQDLQDKIQSEIGVPVQHQRIIVAGKELGDSNALLSSLSITEGSIVHLVVRQNRPNPSDSVSVSLPDQDAVPVEPVAENYFSGENVHQLFSLSRFIMLFTVLDFVFVFLAGLNIPIFLVGLLGPISGFYACRSLKAMFLIPYVFFEVLLVAWRGYLLYAIDSASLRVFYVLGILLDVYIVFLVTKFFLLLRKLSEAERVSMVSFLYPARRVI